MRLNVLIVFFIFFSILVNGQESAVYGWELIIDTPRVNLKQIRIDKLKEFQDETAKLYNVPQGRFYIGIKGGYGVPLLTVNRRNIEDFLGINDYYESDSGQISYKTIVTTDAAGPRYGIYMGVRFNQFIGLEADVSFNYYNSVLQGRHDSPFYYADLSTRTKDISINPQFVITTPNLKNFQLFGKFGFYLPAWIDGKGQSTIHDQDGSILKSFLGVKQEGFVQLLDEAAQYLGTNVAGLDFLSQGIFVAAGYDLIWDAKVDLDFKANINNLGYTGGLGVMYHVSPLISLIGEVKASGYTISTKGYQLEDFDLTLDIGGNRILELTEQGGLLNGQQVISKDEISWLLNVNHHNKLTEQSNNLEMNPETFNPSLPSDKLSIRKSVFAMLFNVSLHINFDGKKQIEKE